MITTFEYKRPLRQWEDAEVWRENGERIIEPRRQKYVGYILLKQGRYLRERFANIPYLLFALAYKTGHHCTHISGITCP
ncbi:unnamed protein product [Nezara viridula]|uniref:Uncharacterized protein n=1 Tax=Nezara viridula TaxID=85310 RepID=A0A9P0H187_NEZVI|nr:unnamed protein product [Nezara viridula]